MGRIPSSTVLLAAILLAACRTAPDPCTGHVDPHPRLLVMSAFGTELAELLAEAELIGSRTIAGREFHVGLLAGSDVVLVSSGISMVNAAMTAQAALDHFEITGILFSGIAGGVNPSLHIGDVAVPARWGQYQEQRFARKTEEGWDPGPRSPEFGHFGMMFPQAVEVPAPEGSAERTDRRFWFDANPAMLSTAERVAGRVSLTPCTPEGRCLDHQPEMVFGGNGVSGTTFVDNAEYRVWVWATFEADVLDKETAAVAHVAYANRVPFIGFRSLSDLAGRQAGQNEIGTFRQLAASNSTALVVAFLQEWTSRP